jgi:hypothetical protein
VVFQAAAATYHFAKSKTMAWGNEDGLKDEWAATRTWDITYSLNLDTPVDKREKVEFRFEIQ